LHGPHLLPVASRLQRTAIPTEVDLAVSQDQSLWKVGVPKYAEREYGEYAAALQAGQELLLAERPSSSGSVITMPSPRSSGSH